MKISEFRVLLAAPTDDDPDATVEHVARILHGDQLRAELEGPKHGFTDLSAAPMHFTTLWVWASLVRTKHIDVGFREFKPTVLGLEKVKPDPAGSADVDPTQPAGASG